MLSPASNHAKGRFLVPTQDLALSNNVPQHQDHLILDRVPGRRRLRSLRKSGQACHFVHHLPQGGPLEVKVRILYPRRQHVSSHSQLRILTSSLPVLFL